MKAALYARKSRYTGKGASIENQLESCKEKANALNISEFSSYSDEGFSGYNMDRPQFANLLDDISNPSNGFTHLICYKIDRVSRNVREFVEFIDTLENLGIIFISVSDNFDMTTPFGHLMMHILIGFAQLEYEMINQRILDNVYALAKNGHWLGGKYPFGFNGKLKKYTDEYGKERQYTVLEVDESKMNTVKTLYKKYLELKSLTKLKSFAYDNNIKSDNDVFFDVSSLRFILRNPVYVKSDENVSTYLSEKRGMNVYGSVNGHSAFLTYGKNISKNKRSRSISVENESNTESNKVIAAVAKHDGIIEPDTWLEIQQILDNNADNAPRSGTGKSSLLSGLLKCDICKKTMGISYKYDSKGNIKNAYYICNTKKRFKASACNCKNLIAKDIDNYILESIKDIDVNKFIQYYKSESIQLNDENTEINKAISDINKNIDNINTGIQNLVIKLSKNNSSIVDICIEKQIEEFNNQLMIETSKLENLNSRLESINTNMDDITKIIETIKDFKSILLLSNIDEKRLLINAIIKEIIWDTDSNTLSIRYLGA